MTYSLYEIRDQRFSLMMYTRDQMISFF